MVSIRSDMQMNKTNRIVAYMLKFIYKINHQRNPQTSQVFLFLKFNMLRQAILLKYAQNCFRNERVQLQKQGSISSHFFYYIFTHSWT